jgi:hypothetical protein
MKITRVNLKKMIQEEIQSLTAEADMLDPNTPLEMPKNLELFIDEVLKAAESMSGIPSGASETDDMYSLLLTQMAPGTELVQIVAEELADLYRSGMRGKHRDPLDYEE